MRPLRVLVVTIVHRPLDARIHARQIAAMRQAGWSVTYAAPWSVTGTGPDDRITARDLPRAVGRHRLHAVRAARRLIRSEATGHDLILLHDPELLVSVAGLRRLPPVVWDVHENPAASLVDREWVPPRTRPILRAGIRMVERWAERRHHLILAETSYQERFRRDHPVVRNLPLVPDQVRPPGPGRAVYLGRISRSRGWDTMLTVADLVRPDVTVELIGYADPDIEPEVQRAHDDGRVVWHGFVPNDEALRMIEGATVGLSLLHDQPNFRGSMPTKIAEYLAHGVPVVTTPLPEAMRLVQASGYAGDVVPFADASNAAEAVLRFHEDTDHRLRSSAAGRSYCLEHTNWYHEAEQFLFGLVRVSA